jgi:hypothetical protein
MFNPFDCSGCDQRREKIAEWTQGWLDWARDPVRNPRPGSKEWFKKHATTDSSGVKHE